MFHYFSRRSKAGERASIDPCSSAKAVASETRFSGCTTRTFMRNRCENETRQVQDGKRRHRIQLIEWPGDFLPLERGTSSYRFARKFGGLEILVWSWLYTLKHFSFAVFFVKFIVLHKNSFAFLAAPKSIPINHRVCVCDIMREAHVGYF